MKEPGVSFFHPKQLSQKLMRVVFCIYLLITVVITSIQFMTEYKRTQNDVLSELEILENNFHTALAASLWQMNTRQLEALTEGLISMPIIDGVDVINPEGEPILELRDYTPEEKPLSVFSIEKNISWTLKNEQIDLGVLRLYSSSDVVGDRVLFGFMLIAINAVVKTIVLWFLFLWAFNRFLGKPLQKLTQKINDINIEQAGNERIELGNKDVNEFQSLQHQFNNMLVRIQNDRQALIQEEEKRRSWLEQEVAARTQELQELNLKLTHLASTDALTGIYNRRAFFELAQLQMDLTQRQAMPLCLMVLDVDNFKLINDTFGHSAGDGVLARFTEIILSKLRKTDIFGRVGGEEFAVLLIDTELDAATNLAEKLRESVASTIIEYETNDIAISVSIGVSKHCQKDTFFKNLFVRSDDLLYKAKLNGRNRVESQSK